MENEILETLKQMQKENQEFRTEVNLKLNRIENDLNGVELITSKNWNDIAKLKAVK